MSHRVGWVRRMVTIEFVLDVMCRRAVMHGLLSEAVQRCGANAGHPEWTLGDVQYRPIAIPNNPDASWLQRDLLVLHPLCRQVAITDEEIERLAAQCNAASLEDASWALCAWADVLVA